MKVPRLNVWITFVIFAAAGSIWACYSAFYSIALLTTSPMESAGYALGNALMIYYLSAVPSIILWNYLKNK